MKRKRGGGILEKGSELRSTIELLSLMKPDGHISTVPFLSVCKLLLQLLDKIGPTMAVLRQDVNENIQRLEKLYEMDPSIYCNLVEIVKAEVVQGTARKATSCTRALVWLTSTWLQRRSMDFSVSLLEKLVEDREKSLPQIVEDAYQNTLKPWHGWISAAAYKVALKLVPDKRSLVKLLMAEEEDHDVLKEEIKSLVLLFLPILNEVHTILRTYRLDRLKST